MKTLSNHITKSFSNTDYKYYHFSYDIIDCEKNFDNKYDNGLKYLLKILHNIGVINIEPYCSSTLLIRYPANSNDIFKRLETELNDNIEYVISLIDSDNIQSKIHSSKNENIKKLWNDIKVTK